MRFFEHKWPALLLWPLSFLFSIVVAIRNKLYAVGFFKSFAVDAFVISVGNITVGGTGKTPTVHYLADKFLSLHKRVAIISRGYGRHSRGTVVVSDGRNILRPVQECGDEPFLLARLCRRAIVVVDANRVRAAALTMEKFAPDIIILDDAFQHRRMKRDFDLLTFRQNRPLGNGFCLPAGPLREPKKNLLRAHAILVNGLGQERPEELLNVRIPILFAQYVVKDIVNQKGDSLLSAVRGSRTFAFCGLAQPDNFMHTLRELGVNILGFMAFNDHHRYGQDDVQKVKMKVQELRADVVLTTEKDWVKLPLDFLDEQWFRLQIEMKPTDEKKLMSLFEIRE
ncbi:tetraacyldisaccharide 4'-kinase [candidate division KSB1 bacterium]|nr:tetraacyldisaccharide 4'-kinase [candidate division KSB1 bacterium]